MACTDRPYRLPSQPGVYLLEGMGLTVSSTGYIILSRPRCCLWFLADLATVTTTKLTVVLSHIYTQRHLDEFGSLTSTSLQLGS